MEQKTKGGKRKGAGRKPLSYKTKTVRIPEPVLPKVNKIVSKFKSKQPKK